MLKGTPFHSKTSALCQSHEWQRWSGYLTAASYELTHEWEYQALRGMAGLIDISPLYKYRITGPDAERLLNRVATRNIAKCAVNQVMYTPWCDDAGKMIDDGTVQRFGEQDFRLTAAHPNLRWLRENSFGMEVTIEDESDKVAALAVQGPASRDILNQFSAGNSKISNLKYFRLTKVQINDIPITISRTGFTGDLGYELWFSPQYAEQVWDGLMEAGTAYGMTPVGMHALITTRIEAGLILVNVDYVPTHQALIDSQKSSPYEMGLGWAVSLKKGNFVGRKALLAEKQRDPIWKFVGLEIDWPAVEQLYSEVGLTPHLSSWLTSVPLYHGNRQIGYATSGCYSPVLKKYIALATIKAAYSRPGTQIMIEETVNHQRKQARARVVKTPFFNPERKRK